MCKRQDPSALSHASHLKFIPLVMALMLTACQSTPTPFASTTPKPINTSTLRIEPTQPTFTETSTRTLSTPTLVTPSASTTVDCLTLGGELHQETIASKNVDELRLQIYLPPCYHTELEKRYPVLYLLHGLSYSDDQWLQLGLAEKMDALIAQGAITPFIVVLPNEAQFNPPQTSNFDDALVTEVIPWIDKHYKTRSERAFRALGGLSRGAAWAVHIGFTHYTLFENIGAHSLPLFEADGGNINTWLARIPSTDLPSFYIDIGRSDQEVQTALNFANLLDEHQVPHEWHLFNGGHTQSYWSSHLETYLKWYARDW